MTIINKGHCKPYISDKPIQFKDDKDNQWLYEFKKKLYALYCDVHNGKHER
jgi:hypothetical protein